MVCDYRVLDKTTIPDANPLPLLSETIEQVLGSVMFSEIGLIGANYKMRIVDKDVPKTVIRTLFESFEWKVLCLGFTNAPAVF